MKIVMIDSGVDWTHPLLVSKRCRSYLTDNGKCIPDNGELIPEFGHGTAVYGILSSEVPGAEFVNVCFRNIEKGIGSDELCSVLEDIWEREQPDLINLSLGIVCCDNERELKKVCEKITSKGCIIISAFDNSGAYSYPAAFDCVIGVISSEKCHKIQDIEYYQDRIVNMGAYGALQRVMWSHPHYMLCGGNSIACAHVTAKLAKQLMECGDREKIKTELFSESAAAPEKSPELQFRIAHAAIFPFNKEMHSLIRFFHLLDFEIDHIYAESRSMYIGCSAAKLLNMETERDWTIESIERIQWEDCDTFILGHTDKLENFSGMAKIGEQLVREARKRKIRVFQFDGSSRKNSSVFFSPSVRKEMLPPWHFGMLYGINRPVLGIFGTSSAQGKFSLQLALREKLSKKGYCIGQIGTEPQSPLFGMDEVFSVGYQNSVEFSGFDTIRYLNRIEHDLCEKNVDLIVVGSQSGSIAYDYGNLKYMNIRQYDFLMGTQPDAVVLCINLFDEPGYIKRTIAFLESSNQSVVIGTAALPLTREEEIWGAVGKIKRLDEEELASKKRELEEELKLPLYYIGKTEDEEKLTERIISFFAVLPVSS